MPLLRAHAITKVALVTDCRHMLRAELCMRKQGMEVVPAPCCCYSETKLDSLRDYVPSAMAIRENEGTLHEWVGLAWYRIRGRI